jgi:hypothetical protein
MRGLGFGPFPIRQGEQTFEIVTALYNDRLVPSATFSVRVTAIDAQSLTRNISEACHEVHVASLDTG